MPVGGTLTLSTGADVTIAAEDVYSVVVGVGGAERLFLNSNGLTLTVTDVNHIYGASGYDVITLGGLASNSLNVQNIETVIGNVGLDTVSITVAGSTMTISDIETLIGAASATDVVTLSGFTGNSISVS